MDEQYRRDIESIARQMLREELRLDVKNPSGRLIIRLILGDEVIGRPFVLLRDIKPDG